MAFSGSKKVGGKFPKSEKKFPGKETKRIISGSLNRIYTTAIKFFNLEPVESFRAFEFKQ